MKTLARNIPIKLAGLRFECDVLLGMYATSQRPAIILNSARPLDMDEKEPFFSEPIAVATINLPEEVSIYLPPYQVVAKDYSENEGLWEQLLLLKDATGEPIFSLSQTVLRLPFNTVLLYNLSPATFALFHSLREEALHQGDFHV